MMDEDDDLEQLTNKYPQKLFSDSSVPPVHLPLNLNAFTPIKTTPIGISKKDCNDEVPMNVDTNDGAAVSAVREECPTTVADVLTDVSSSDQAYRACMHGRVSVSVEACT